MVRSCRADGTGPSSIGMATQTRITRSQQGRRVNTASRRVHWCVRLNVDYARTRALISIRADMLAQERTLSNSSSLFRETMGGQAPSPHSAVPMALNGSNFGAASSLDYPYDEKVMGDLGASPTPGYYSGLTAHPQMDNEHEMQSLHTGHVGVDGLGIVGPHGAGGVGGVDVYGGAEMDEDYTTYPPVMGHSAHPAAMAGAGVYDSGSEDGDPHLSDAAETAARQMTVTNPDHVTYGR